MGRFVKWCRKLLCDHTSTEHKTILSNYPATIERSVVCLKCGALLPERIGDISTEMTHEYLRRASMLKGGERVRVMWGAGSQGTYEPYPPHRP